MKKIISGIIALTMLVSAVILSPAAAEPPVLKPDSVLLMTKDGSAVCGTNGAITADTLAGEFAGAVQVKNPAGETITGATAVPAGSTVVADGGAISVVIHGDANADGSINLSDVTAMLQSIAKWDVTVNETAADPTVDGAVNLGDVTLLLKYIAKWDVKLGYNKIIVNSDKQTAAAEDEATALWFEHSTTKLAQNNTESSGEYTYVINAAKNEIEGANVYVSPAEDKKDVTISVTDFVNCYGDTVESDELVFWYHNMDVTRPDAIFPADKYAADVKAGTSQGFIIKAKTTEDTDVGLYEAVVSIKSEDREIKRAKVYLNVWDFTLDDKDAPDTSFGYGRGAMANSMLLNSNEDVEEMYKISYDYLLENRMCLANLPYDISDERCDEYLNDGRVRSFLIAGDGYGGEYTRTDEQIRAYYEKLSQNPEWFDKGYFYYVDEPHFEDDFNKMDTWRAYIDSVYPGGKQLVPLDSHKVIHLPMGIYVRLERSVDIWCPITHLFTPQKYRGNDDYEVFNTPEFIEQYGTYDVAVKNAMEKDPDIESWWYTAGRPVTPYANLHAEDDGTVSRILFWQQYQYDVTGYLFYLINDYTATNPLRNMPSRENVDLHPGKKFWGSGILVYSGIRDGVKDEPVWSIRIESIRDGIEDYMYMMMAERIVGEDAVKDMILEVSRDITDYDRDADKMLGIRERLAGIIMSAE